MWTSLYLILALSLLDATAAWAGAWNEPSGVLGLDWGAPLAVARQQFPGGRLSPETTSILAYTTTTHLDGVPVSASFQFVSEEGLQGVVLRFPLHRLADMVAIFERQYGLAPVRGNQQWRWEGAGVTISLGVAGLHPADTPQSLIERADNCLYAAKRNGRNRVICEADPEVASVAETQVA